MAQPTIRVRLGFTPNTFTLDDLIRGKLDLYGIFGRKHGRSKYGSMDPNK